MKVSDSNESRSLREEIKLWLDWRRDAPENQVWKHWNNDLFSGLLLFPIEQNWIPRSVLFILIGFAAEIVGLIPILAFGHAAPLIVTDGFLILGTITYFEYRVWAFSKLVFIGFIPFMLLSILIALGCLLLAR